MSRQRTAGLGIVAAFGGRTVTRDGILRWEDRRVTAAARKLGVEIPAGDVAQRREAMLLTKLELGGTAIAARLSRAVRWADRASRLAARTSGGRRRASVCDVHVDGGCTARHGDRGPKFAQFSTAEVEESTNIAEGDDSLARLGERPGM